MKFYENYIELSDAHVMWRLNNPNLNNDEVYIVWQYLINECNDAFREAYGCSFYMLGRSGRHVCVEDTPKNRQRWYFMKNKIEKLQKWMVEEFNKTKPGW